MAGAGVFPNTFSIHWAGGGLRNKLVEANGQNGGGTTGEASGILTTEIPQCGSCVPRSPRGSSKKLIEKRP